MKHRNALLFIAFALFGFLLTSCQKELGGVESLELSEYGTVAFEQAGGQKEISVKTENPKWTAAPNAEWIKVSQGSDSFVISAEANKTTAPRSGEVLVLSGSLSQRIPVEQAPMSDEIYIGTETGENGTLTLTQAAQELSVTILSKSGEWTVEENLPDWITYERVLDTDKLIIKVTENTSTEARTHKLFIHSKEAVQEIMVTQNGKLVYILPYLVPYATTDEVKAFEEKRQSTVQLDASYLNNGAHTYVTQSDKLRVIKYSFNSSKELVEVKMIAEDIQTITGEKFTSLLESEGFEYIGDDGFQIVYVKKTKKDDVSYEIIANITYQQNPFNGSVYKSVLFRFIKGQKGEHPTFNSLPLGIGRFDVVTDQVAAWESTNGGKLNPVNTIIGTDFSEYFYDVFDRTYITRRYIFNNATDKLEQMDFFFYDPNKIFYSPEEGVYYLTNEFKELLQREGFTDIQNVDNNPDFKTFYKSPDRKIALAFRVGHYAEINDGTPVAHMMLVPF